jgi:alginate O-acetyltransferase complex protein AlgI
MQFNSLVFLYLFLPVTLILTFLSPRPSKNSILLAVSLVFYAWGGPSFTFILLASIILNYLIGLLIEPGKKPAHPIGLALGIILNILLLAAFKYSGFIMESINPIIRLIGWEPLPVFKPLLPLGISFFTFRAITYLMAVHRSKTRAQRNPIDLALFIAIFPQVIAGPIERYESLIPQIGNRTVTIERFSSGIRRFGLGMAKKVFISAPLAQVADRVFSIPPVVLAPDLAWLGAITFTLQIYYDFSGYSDMAIGLGRMFGFEFTENFNFPFCARSVREFWKRWHITLSSWLRDYLFLPLAYRASNTFPKERYIGIRTENLIYAYTTLTTFAICGLWHGAALNFIAWGTIHGLLLTGERTRFGKWLDHGFQPLAHIYLVTVISLSFVVFRSSTLNNALAYLAAMSGFTGSSISWITLQSYLDREFILMITIAILGVTPLFDFWRRWIMTTGKSSRPRLAWLFIHGYHLAAMTVPLLCLLGSSLRLVANGNTSFLYFKF